MLADDEERLVLVDRVRSTVIRALCDLAHGTDPRLWEGAALSVEVADHVLNGRAELAIEGYRIISMDSRDKVRASTHIDMICFAPLHPFMVFVELFHLLTISIAFATSFS